MRRIRFGALIPVVVLVLAAGCGGDDDGDGGAATGAATAGGSTAAATGGTSTAEPGTGHSEGTAGTDATESTTGPVGGSAGADDLDRDATLRMAWTVQALALDPHTGPSPAALYPYVSPVYDRLVSIGVNGEIKPMMAESWDVADDGVAVTFHLRDGIVFSDGTSFDATAVERSFDRALHLPESTVATELSMIDSVEVVDPMTVTIRTNRLAADLLPAIGNSPGSIISPAAIDNADLDIHPVGSGPFVLKELSLGDRAIYERNPNYWDPDAVKVQTLELIGIPDDNARFNALQTGQIDFMLGKLLQYEQLSSLGDGFSFVTQPPAAVYTIMLNGTVEPLDDPQVRQAISMAVDRDGIDESLLYGQCPPASQPLQEGQKGYLDDLAGLADYDPDAARQLLADAGYPDGFSMRMLVIPGIRPQADFAPILQAQLGEIGIDVELVNLELAQANEGWVAGDYDAFVNIYPRAANEALYLSSNFLTARFLGALPDGMEEAILAAFDPTLDEAELTESLETANRLAAENTVSIFLCGVKNLYAAADDVTGIENMGFAATIDPTQIGIRAG